MLPSAIGHGAGSRDLGEVANVLRMIVGRAPDHTPEEDEVAVLECTLDDATPQALAFALERLRDGGALDAFSAPVTMKKGRAGQHVTVLARPEDSVRLGRLLLRETPTLGLRLRLERRLVLSRELRRVDTEYGPVAIKVGLLDGEELHGWPEYDDCAAAAERHGVPLSRVQQAALAAYARERGPAGRDGEGDVP
jgi:uncharacterized protein (DUF111 family)